MGGEVTAEDGAGGAGGGTSDNCGGGGGRSRMPMAAEGARSHRRWHTYVLHVANAAAEVGAGRRQNIPMDFLMPFCVSYGDKGC
jgi:hypothetical protein